MVETHDLRGFKCPQPTLKMTILTTKMQEGSILEVLADCPSFEEDVKSWCGRTKKTLLWIRDDGGHKKCQIQL